MAPRNVKKPKSVSYLCLSCGASGPRSDSYKHLPKECPAYEDQCPNCNGFDIDVFNECYDPALEAPNTSAYN